MFKGITTVFRNHIYENLVMGLNTLRANKLRSGLTIVGVVIGVITVMLISSIISGIDAAVKKEVESFGTRSIFIAKFDPGIRTGNLTREERLRKPLTEDDAEALKQLPALETAVPILDISNNFFGQRIMITGPNGKTTSNVNIQGTYPDIEKSGSEIMLEGRWFTDFEATENQKVCVIGAQVADNFFNYGSPVGQELEIGGEPYRIVGLLQKREQMLFGGGSDDSNNTIYVPFGVAQKLKPNAQDLFILAVAKSVGQMDTAKDQITDMLRVRRQVPFGQPNNFGMATSESIVEQFRAITGGVAIAMIVISSVGLMIGGIGVMNIMLVSVTERTREIGIRKAIGARRSDIMLQFLIEAMTLTGFGGLLGLAIGWGLTFLVRLAMPSYVPLWAPIVGFVASVSIGLFFGLFPAWKAARLDPIESLRYE
ncbi:MAG TPA: ABC transporter permease [Pyrinomonadaceae bacterium]|nr:ABC transporter permease [Pyrinomonadaceae bacterium]